MSKKHVEKGVKKQVEMSRKEISIYIVWRLLSGEIQERGMILPLALDIYRPILKRLEAEGLVAREHVTGVKRPMGRQDEAVRYWATNRNADLWDRWKSEQSVSYEAGQGTSMEIRWTAQEEPIHFKSWTLNYLNVLRATQFWGFFCGCALDPLILKSRPRPRW